MPSMQKVHHIAARTATVTELRVERIIHINGGEDGDLITPEAPAPLADKTTVAEIREAYTTLVDRLIEAGILVPYTAPEEAPAAPAEVPAETAPATTGE